MSINEFVQYVFYPIYILNVVLMVFRLFVYKDNTLTFGWPPRVVSIMSLFLFSALFYAKLTNNKIVTLFDFMTYIFPVLLCGYFGYLFFKLKFQYFNNKFIWFDGWLQHEILADEVQKVIYYKKMGSMKRAEIFLKTGEIEIVKNYFTAEVNINMMIQDKKLYRKDVKI